MTAQPSGTPPDPWPWRVLAGPAERGKRLGLDVRWQRVATPGIRVTTLATCLSVAW